MTFRVDDLLIAVLPERGQVRAGESDPPIEPDTGSMCNDGNSQCPPAPDAPEDTAVECDQSNDARAASTIRAWRDEQYELLSRDLESALAS